MILALFLIFGGGEESEGSNVVEEQQDWLNYVMFRDIDTLYLNGHLTESHIFAATKGVEYHMSPSLDELTEGNQTIRVAFVDDEGTERIIEQQYTFVGAFSEWVYTLDYAGMTAEDVVREYINQTSIEPSLFSCFYYNPTTKEEYVYRPDEFYQGASTIKLPMSMYYYDLINKGELSEDYRLPFEEKNVQEGVGMTVYDYNVGAEIPISYLVEQALVESDNTAMSIMMSHIGSPEYRSVLAQYSENKLAEEFYQSNVITAQYCCDVMKYFYEHIEEYSLLEGYLKRASPGEYLEHEFSAYEIADKYGSYEDDMHDYGIVYAPQEYLIGVFTTGVGNAESHISNINKWLLGYTLYNLNGGQIAIGEAA